MDEQLTYMLKIATDGLKMEDVEYKNICLELIINYIQNEIFKSKIKPLLKNCDVLIDGCAVPPKYPSA